MNSNEKPLVSFKTTVVATVFLVIVFITWLIRNWFNL